MDWLVYFCKSALIVFVAIAAAALTVSILINMKKSLVGSWGSGAFLFTIFVHLIGTLVTGTLTFECFKSFVSYLDQSYPSTPLFSESDYSPKSEIAQISSSSNGVQEYVFKVEKSMSGTGNVGNDWSFSYTVAGQLVKPNSTVELTPGERIMVNVTVTEDDESMPDVGHDSKAVTVDTQAFTVEASARVRENGGNHAGEYVTWNFTYTFTPK